MIIKKVVSLFQKKRSFTQWCTIIFSSILSLTLVLLFFQYRSFQKITLELSELKEEYRVYTLGLKKMLEETTKEGEQEEKKKITYNLPIPVEDSCVVCSDQVQESFLVVNRDDEYLLENALLFSKEHQLDQAVGKMLDVQEWKKRVMPVLSKKKKQKRKKGSEIVGLPSGKNIARITEGAPRDFVFSWPVDKSKFWLSSLFGPRKMKKSGWKFHYGIDMAALKGTRVKAAATGIVLESRRHGGYGNCIIIAHNKKYKTRYAHLNTRKVRVGQKVKKGEVIGTVGDTGLIRKSGKDGSHLHFEVYSYGRRVNPLSVLA